MVSSGTFDFHAELANWYLQRRSGSRSDLRYRVYVDFILDKINLLSLNQVGSDTECINIEAT